jgi:hypothetical protein
MAALYYGGNQALSRAFLVEQGYRGHPLSRSRLCRRLARVRHQFMTLFHRLDQVSKACIPENIYLLDSLPIAVCDNYRVRRCGRACSAGYRGY